MNNILHISLLLIGLIFAINAILGGIVQIYGGRLGDVYGFKKIIIVFASAYFVTLFLLFYTSIAFPLPILFVALFILNQAVGALLMPSLSALLSLSSDIPLAGFSYMRVASNLGWAFGPAMAGVIAGTIGYPYIYLTAAISTLISLPLYVFYLKDKKNAEALQEKFSFTKVKRELYLFGIGIAFLFVVVSQFSVTLSIYANHFEGLSSTAIGLIYFVNGIAVAAFQLPIYRLVSKIGLWNGMILGSVLYIAGYFSMAFDHSLAQFMLSMLVVTMGENAVTPTGSAMVARIAAGKDMGVNMGMYNFFMSLGRGMGPSYGSLLLSYVPFPLEIWGLAVSPAVIAILAFISRKNSEQRSFKNQPTT
jgi:MFS family permease